MTVIGHAIDVSHHQPIGSVGFDQIASDRPTPGWVTSCVIRATYGRNPDRLTGAHLRAADDAGFDHVGLYAFYRPGVAVLPQRDAFIRQIDRLNFGLPNDLVPILDVEDDGLTSLEPWHVPGILEMLRCLELDCYVRPMLYLSLRGYDGLGRPKALLEYPLWAPHYTTKAAGAAPPGDVVMWQHRVGPYEGPHAAGGYFEPPGQLDQSRILQPLPTWA